MDVARRSHIQKKSFNIEKPKMTVAQNPTPAARHTLSTSLKPSSSQFKKGEKNLSNTINCPSYAKITNPPKHISNSHTQRELSAAKSPIWDHTSLQSLGPPPPLPSLPPPLGRKGPYTPHYQSLPASFRKKPVHEVILNTSATVHSITPSSLPVSFISNRSSAPPRKSLLRKSQPPAQTPPPPPVTVCPTALPKSSNVAANNITASNGRMLLKQNSPCSPVASSHQSSEFTPLSTPLIPSHLVDSDSIRTTLITSKFTSSSSKIHLSQSPQHSIAKGRNTKSPDKPGTPPPLPKNPPRLLESRKSRETSLKLTSETQINSSTSKSMAAENAPNLISTTKLHPGQIASSVASQPQKTKHIVKIGAKNMKNLQLSTQDKKFKHQPAILTTSTTNGGDERNKKVAMLDSRQPKSGEHLSVRQSKSGEHLSARQSKSGDHLSAKRSKSASSEHINAKQSNSVEFFNGACKNNDKSKASQMSSVSGQRSKPIVIGSNSRNIKQTKSLSPSATESSSDKVFKMSYTELDEKLPGKVINPEFRANENQSWEFNSSINATNEKGKNQFKIGTISSCGFNTSHDNADQFLDHEDISDGFLNPPGRRSGEDSDLLTELQELLNSKLKAMDLCSTSKRSGDALKVNSEGKVNHSQKACSTAAGSDTVNNNDKFTLSSLNHFNSHPVVCVPDFEKTLQSEDGVGSEACLDGNLLFNTNFGSINGRNTLPRKSKPRMPHNTSRILSWQKPGNSSAIVNIQSSVVSREERHFGKSGKSQQSQDLSPPPPPLPPRNQLNNIKVMNKGNSESTEKDGQWNSKGDKTKLNSPLAPVASSLPTFTPSRSTVAPGQSTFTSSQPTSPAGQSTVSPNWTSSTPVQTPTSQDFTHVSAACTPSSPGRRTSTFGNSPSVASQPSALSSQSTASSAAAVRRPRLSRQDLPPPPPPKRSATFSHFDNQKGPQASNQPNSRVVTTPGLTKVRRALSLLSRRPGSNGGRTSVIPAAPTAQQSQTLPAQLKHGGQGCISDGQNTVERKAKRALIQRLAHRFGFRKSDPLKSSISNKPSTENDVGNASKYMQTCKQSKINTNMISLNNDPSHLRGSDDNGQRCTRCSPTSPESNCSPTSPESNCSPTWPDILYASLSQQNDDLHQQGEDKMFDSQLLSSGTDSDVELEVEEIYAQKKARKAFLIAQEIVSSESTFVDVLRLLNLEFRNYISNLAVRLDQAVVPAEILNKILDFLPQLQNLNEDLLRDLRQRIDDWEKNPRLADVFTRKGPFLKLYSSYIRNFENATSILEEACKRNSNFALAVKEFEMSPRCARLSLKHYMLKPIQRIPQYKLLLQDYLKQQNEGSPDYKDTVAALSIVSEVAEHANNTLRYGDNLQKLLEIQRSLIGQFEVIQPGRVLVKQGELQKLSRKEMQPRMFFLFSDVLLYTTPTTTGYRVNNILHLTGMKVSSPKQEDFKFEFSIISVQRSFTLRASSHEEKNEWMSALSGTIEENIKKNQTFQIVRQGLQTSLQDKDFVLGHKAPLWIPDARVTMCMLCLLEFTMTWRRHHCRACGRVVCSHCSENRAPLKYLKYEAARVCDHCFETLQKAQIFFFELTDAFEKSQKQRALLHGQDLSCPLSEVASESTLVAREFLPGQAVDLESGLILQGLLSRFQKIRTSGHDKRRPSTFRPSVLKEVHANDGGCDMCGYLQVFKHRKWKRLWFVVKGKVLYTYKASEDMAAIESMPLLGYHVKRFDSSFEGCLPDLLFELSHQNNQPLTTPRSASSGVTAPGSERTPRLVFRTDNALSTERWISVLETASITEP